MKKYQVNISYQVTDLELVNPLYTSNAWMGKYQGDAIMTIDNEYADDNIDFTEWCVFSGSKQECEQYVENLKKNQTKKFISSLVLQMNWFHSKKIFIKLKLFSCY